MKTIPILTLGVLFASLAIDGAQPGVLISGATRVSTSGSGGSYQPVLSPDGRFVAFVSHANDLAANDRLAPYLDVFLRDRLGGGLVLVSVSTNGIGGGNDRSAGPSISADGRHVAFQSDAGNLAPNDTNGLSDVFLRDVAAGTTTLVSRELGGRSAAGHASSTPLISTNGRWLVFESTATNLVANDTNQAADIFVFDRDTGGNSLVSINEAGNGSRRGTNVWANLTPDGRYVAFVSFTNNFSLVVSHVLVRDTQAGTTTCASSNAALLLATSGTYQGVLHPMLSADGSAVFFHAYNNGGMTNLYQFHLGNGTTTRIGESSMRSAPSPSRDGRFVAYESNAVVRIWDALSSNSIVAGMTYWGGPAPYAEGPARPMLSADGTRVSFLSKAGHVTTNWTNGLTQLYQRDLVAGTNYLLSVATNGVAAGDLAAVVPATSEDGRIVAFESASAAMAPGDFNLASDVFVRDGATGTTALMSGREATLPSATGVAPVMSFTNALSADGRYVVYGSLDNGLFPRDTNGVQDIFVRDTLHGSVEAVSVSGTGAFTNLNHSLEAVLSAGGRHVAYVVSAVPAGLATAVFWRDLEAGQTRAISEPGGGSWSQSLAPTLSADGRWVAFQTTHPADRYMPGLTDLTGMSDIVLQDTWATTNLIISRNRFGTATGNGASSGPLFSPDGRWLAFVSRATDLTTNSISGQHLFVRDLESNVTVVASVALPFPVISGYLGGATFSRDSQWLAFNASGNYVFLFNLAGRTNSIGCTNCRNLKLSADGRWLAVEGIQPRQVVLYDRSTGIERRLGTNMLPNLPGGPQTYYPVLSSDARFLLFLARRFNLDPADTTSRPNLYLHNIAAGVTRRLPISPAADSGNGPTYLPQLAADDRTLMFASFASDLVSGDYNDRRDVFVLRLAAPDSDGDGLDDDFEVAYFGDLSRDGHGDFDGDGHSDRDESLAGTDPTNQGSVLRVRTVASISGEAATVIWESVPGRHYEVQFKDDVAAGWSMLPGQVTATSTTASKLDISLPRPAGRFYRVALVP